MSADWALRAMPHSWSIPHSWTHRLTVSRQVNRSINQRSVAQCLHLTAGGAVQSAGGEASQVTQVLEQVEARHADGFWLQLRHLDTHTLNTHIKHTHIFVLSI